MGEAGGAGGHGDVTRDLGDVNVGRVLELAADLWPDLALISDETGRIVCANSASRGVLGDEPAALLGRPIAEVMVAEPNAVWADLLRRLPDEHHVTVETSLRRPDGTRSPVEVVAARVEADGRFWIFVMARDISKRHRSAAEFRRSEELYRTTVNALEDWLHVVDDRLRFVLMNDAFTDINARLGLPTEVAGKLLREVYPFLTPERLAEYRQVIETGRSLTTEETSDIAGRTFITETKKVPVFEGGRVARVVTLIRDITALRQAEAERRRLEARMQRVQRAESLGVLAGGLAHDFNNLLTTILGNAELLLGAIGGAAPARRQLLKVTTAARRAAELTQQLLAYAGGGQFALGRLDLSLLVAEAVRLLPASRTRNLEVTTELAPGLPDVEGDPAQVRQAVMSCLLNAVEAIGDQAGALTVRTGATDLDRSCLGECTGGEDLPPGRYVWIEVEDTGCGIPSEDLGRIFDPFFSTKFTGRGLGLAAVLGIARALAGAVHVASVPGRGSTFRILLPALASRSNEPAPPPTTPANGRR